MTLSFNRRTFLRTASLLLAAALLPFGSSARADELKPEKTTLKLGIIKLTDCAPLVVAKEKGFFTDEGLDVTLEAQANWKVVLDRVISGELDGSHMLATQPVGATIGFGTKADVITAYVMGVNGNGITVSNAVWDAMKKADPKLDSPAAPHPISAAALKPLADKAKADGKLLQMGMVFPVSTHNYQLRAWLANGGIHPGFYTTADTTGTQNADIQLSVTPPPQMPSTMQSGTICGYCVGEPWNEKAVMSGIGVAVSTSTEISDGINEKVFGVSEAWATKNPQTHLAVLKALIRASKWLDATDKSGKFLHREEACRLLSKPNYVGADYEILANSMTGSFYYQKTDKVALPNFNVFFKNQASYPHYSDCVWYLTQMRRWGQIGEPKPDAWYAEVAKKVYRPDLYLKAAQMLADEGELKASDLPAAGYDGYKPASSAFVDGVEFDGHQPNAYLKKLKIGHNH